MTQRQGQRTLNDCRESRGAPRPSHYNLQMKMKAFAWKNGLPHFFGHKVKAIPAGIFIFWCRGELVTVEIGFREINDKVELYASTTEMHSVLKSQEDIQKFVGFPAAETKFFGPIAKPEPNPVEGMPNGVN